MVATIDVVPPTLVVGELEVKVYFSMVTSGLDHDIATLNEWPTLKISYSDFRVTSTCVIINFNFGILDVIVNRIFRRCDYIVVFLD